MGKNQWVSPRDGKWAVHGEGNSKDTKIFDKKSDAVEYGKNISKNQQSEFIVQKRMAKFSQKIVLEMILYLHVIQNINHI